MQSNYHNFSKDDLVLNNKYIIKDLISSGSTAEVYKCIDIETGLPKAAKIFQKISINGFKTEAEIMEKISEINSSSLIVQYPFGKLTTFYKSWQLFAIVDNCIWGVDNNKHKVVNMIWNEQCGKRQLIIT